MNSTNKKPPNYRSRKLQLQLFVLVSMLMLVLLAMDKARKPQTWAWMWRLDRTGQAEKSTDGDTNSPNEKSVSRPHPLDFLNAPRVNTEALPMAPDAALPADAIQTANPQGELPADGTPEQKLYDDLWSRLLQPMNASQQLLLDEAFYLHRRQRRLPQERAEAWSELFALLTDQSALYFQQAQRATEHAVLTTDQQGAWLDLLNREQAAWTKTLAHLQSLGPTVESESEPPSNDGDQSPDQSPDQSRTAAIQRIQQSLDRLALANVKDAMVHRSVERRAWFRMFERLRELEIDEQDQNYVSFMEVFRQPAAHRGKLITIHGTAVLGYRVKAPANPYEIDEYSVLWVRPTTNPGAPIVIYALGTPPGFPTIVSRTTPANRDASTTLSEEMEVTGYFFKNWAYASGEGISTAPLVLATQPNWTPEPPFVTAPLNGFWFGTGVAITVIIAILLAWSAFGSTRTPAREHAKATEAFANLADQDLPTTADHLQRLREEELKQ